MGKLIALILVGLMICSCQQSKQHLFEKKWGPGEDRVWIGSEFWANRLQDWKVQNGRLECVASNPQLLMRTAHLIRYRLDSTNGDFFANINFGALQSSQNPDAAAGLLIGAGPDIDVWGASLIQQKPGPGAGLFAGVSASGFLFLKDMETGITLDSIGVPPTDGYNFKVALSDGHPYKLVIEANETRLEYQHIKEQRARGNIALVSHPGTGNNPGTFWFNNFQSYGSKLTELDHTAGPIISTQYTLSDHSLSLTAQLVPVGENDPELVTLEANREGKWESVAESNIVIPGYTAHFRIPNWQSDIDIPYRVVYSYISSEGKQTSLWEGVIRHDPVEKNEIVVAGFTGNHNVAHPGLSGTSGTFNFDHRGIWYPHIELVNNVKQHQPDLLFFSGDQVYEGRSPTFPDTEHYELDYLYKWYLYCLAYRDLTKDIPTVSIPDDHDVYQGNLWGQEGRATDTDHKGGYVHPAWFVKMVERTQVSNLPEPYDPTPIEQGIGVYYTSINYGGIGFAVLEDRKFKSGCVDNPFMSRGRPDHVIDPQFDKKKIDLPGKKMLGERQLDFLADWVTDWKGHEMKMALSQTVFANMATHHGGDLFRLIADLDSDGWPQTGRNKAIDALRKGFVFHLAGDQHLASIVHHGVDTWNDGIYSFCVPSVANFYPRAWWPEAEGQNRPEGADKNMGKHLDGFGNYVTVYAVTNPTAFTKVSTNREPLILHDKMPGYGIVRLDKDQRTITMECWPRYADPANDQEQYEGWPKIISQLDNFGKEAVDYLPTLQVEGSENPAVAIVNENTGELVYSIRMNSNSFKPKVFGPGSYTLVVSDPEKEIEQVFSGISVPGTAEHTIDVNFN
jgi:hypothetical protein